MVWAFDMGIERILDEGEAALLKEEGALIGNRAETPFIGVSCVGPPNAQLRTFEVDPDPLTGGPDVNPNLRRRPMRQSETENPQQGGRFPNPETPGDQPEDENSNGEEQAEYGSEAPGPFQERDMDTSEHIVQKVCVLREIQKSSTLRSTLIRRRQRSLKWFWLMFGGSHLEEGAHDWRGYEMARRLL